MSMQRRRLVAALGFLMIVSVGSEPDARADLDAYVQHDDGAFAWTTAKPRVTPLGTIHEITLTSQVWHGITWTHRLNIHEPRGVKPGETCLLFITGGNQDSTPSEGDDMAGFALAAACLAPCATLHQVPNQPLLDNQREDALIAETFLRFIETRDETWPLLFPMVKSAVRAMDAVQEWAKRENRPAVESFVVNGASKRGWTTWLTGAADKRVLAIAPMVIDTLNMKAQKSHAEEVWGRQSEQIDDYTSRGLTEKYDTEAGRRLWMMVDPYAYRDRLTMPKLLINGTNDRYWTLDALNIYWGDLKGSKSVVYLPNAGHGLEEHRDYAVNGISALFRHATAGRPMPALTWKHSDSDSGRLRLVITSTPPPTSAQLWVATAPTRDFREAQWTARPLKIEGSTMTGEVERPATGYVSLLGDLEFRIGPGAVTSSGTDAREQGHIGYHLSTQIRQAGAGPEK